MSKPVSSYYDATKYLGQFIGEQEQFMRETACMSPEIRLTLAVLESAAEFFKDDEELLELIAQLKPLLKRIGHARWERDTVTDMAIKKANPTETEEFADGDNATSINSTKDG